VHKYNMWENSEVKPGGITQCNTHHGVKCCA